jgi:hypothetical protein
MASRYTYWVILDGDSPTAFRANVREELVPTMVQLQRTNPNVTIRWFARGRLWESQVEERDALRAARTAPNTRTRDWRPGGTHKDPRARFELTRDQKRARFKKRLTSGPPRAGASKPSGPKGR